MGSEAYKGSKAELLKKYGPKIKEIYGAEEFNYIKEESSGPGGVDRLRSLLDSMDAKTLNRGGMVKKRSKKFSQGGTTMAMGKAKMAKKKMMQGGMAKKKMRGGGMMKKKMMGGGMAKMAKKKKMMRGGMAKKKK